MPFNHEDKVGYQELAPSLRELLDKIEAEVKGRQSEYIKGNADLIKNLQGRATKLENNDKLNSLYELTENDDEFSASGQVLKINPSAKKLYQHDEFLARRIVSNQYEKDDEMIRIPDTMEKIFTTWKRYAHFDRFSTMLLDRTNYGRPGEYPEGQNLDHRIYKVYTDPKQTGWRFNKNTNCIEATIDGVATAGFISPTADYANYYLKTMVDTGWDDDNLMIIIGYTKDSKGKEHTLSLVRGSGTFPNSLQLEDVRNGKLEQISSFMHNGKKLYKRPLYNLPARVLPKNDGNNFIIGNPTFTYPRSKFRDAFNSVDAYNHDATTEETRKNGAEWDNIYRNEIFPKSSAYYGVVFDCTFWWGLIYDMGNDTQFIITDLSDEVGPAPFATNHRAVETATTIAYISAQRDGNYFKFTTTGWSVDGSADTILPQGTFEFSCPEEKPATWSDEMYDNIQKMCLEPSHIGFGCRSGLPRFTIVEQQGIFKDENIYSVYEDKEYKFNPRTVGWDAIGKVSENKSFTQKIFLYNPRLKTLYWYNDAFDYTKISMHPELKEFTVKGKDGQILKYNGRKDILQYDDEFHICNVVDNDKDFETIKNTRFSLKDIFDNWDRISGRWDDAIPTTYKWQNLNTDGQIAARNAYSFDEVSQMIINSRNSYETSAFLSKDYYNGFKIKLGLNGYDDDDDPIFMIVGFMTDEKGIQHDISVVRCGGAGPDRQHESGPLFLMYDAMSYLCTREGQMTPNNIADHNSANYKMLILKGLEYSDDLRRMQWQDGEVELEIRRGKTSNGTPFIEARSCNPGEHIDYNKPRTFFRYELPRAVPEHWSAEQYLNIVNMLTSESKVGFGTQSNPCKFRIISQEGFIQDEKIYHLKRNRVYTRAQGSDWRENGTIPDHMMSKVLMYNKKTKKLFWYNDESQDKSTTDYLQLESKTKINPQNNDHDINASFIVGTFYDQTIGATIKVPTTSRKEISATIKITK
jgi:hypothetical protein